MGWKVLGVKSVCTESYEGRKILKKQVKKPSTSSTPTSPILTLLGDHKGKPCPDDNSGREKESALSLGVSMGLQYGKLLSIHPFL